MTPFTNKSLLLLLIITVLYLSFNFWDFSVANLYLWEFPVHPIINMVLKSILIGVIYVFLILKLKISPEFDSLLKKYYK
jgi:hypothetical protein